MNPEWLRYYVTLAQVGNFHQAAEQLHITPQALSKALAALERQFGLPLIERDHRFRRLTEAGTVLLEEARAVLSAHEQAERRMTDLKSDEPQGPVSIAGDGLWHHYLLPPLLRELQGRYPKIRPQLYEMLPDDVERWVAAGEVEVGLLLRAPSRHDLEWSEGMSTPYAIVGLPQPTRPWQDLGYVVPRAFRRELADPLDGWSEKAFPRRIVAEVELLETAIKLCEAGVGVAFLPELAVRDQLASGRLAVVSEAPCTFRDTLYLVWRRGAAPSPAARAVLEAVRGAKVAP